jgi:hypothetical protein
MRHVDASLLSGLRPYSKPNCGWLRPCTLGRFSLLAQRKATKRKGTPWSAPANTAGSLAPRLPQGVRIRRIPAPDAHARASRPRLCGPVLRLHASLGLTKGGLKTPLRIGLRWVAPTPVEAIRAPSKAGSLREIFDRARGALCAPGELGERPAEARRAGYRERCMRAAKRPGRVSFGSFSLHEQRKGTCRGSATHKYASPQATQNHAQGTKPTNTAEGRSTCHRLWRRHEH